MFKWLNSDGANNVVQFSCTLKLMCLLKKSFHDDIIKAKEVYIQQSFGRYKGKLVLRNSSPSVYFEMHIDSLNVECKN